jgi:hypothetical protein
MRLAPRATIPAGVWLAGVALAAPALAQSNVPVRTLGPPEFEFTEPMTRVMSVRALSDGRVIASDMGERVVKLLDPRTQSATTVGRQGQGPGEYVIPGPLLPAAGDTTWLVDMVARRFLVITPTGTTPTTMPIVEGPTSALQLMIPSAADRSGRLYAEQTTMMAQRGARGAAVQFPESIPIVRIDRARGSTDTIVWSQQPKMSIEVSGAGRGGQMRARGASPFAGRDGWAAGADGSVAIARVNAYRVEWIAPNGQRTVGPPLPYTQQKVTDADKEAVIKESQAMMMGVGGAMPAGFDLRTFLESMDWPENKPPFLGQLYMAPDGRVWIPTAPPVYGGDITYDVVDRQGRLVERVKMPAKTRMLGFSGGALYTARVDEDDLQYIQRRRP